MANASYCCQSTSVMSLTALLLSSLLPSSSVKAASMSRVESPRANISVARCSNWSVLPLTCRRTLDSNGSSPVSDTWGTANGISPSALSKWPVR